MFFGFRFRVRVRVRVVRVRFCVQRLGFGIYLFGVCSVFSLFGFLVGLRFSCVFLGVSKCFRVSVSGSGSGCLAAVAAVPAINLPNVFAAKSKAA